MLVDRAQLPRLFEKMVFEYQPVPEVTALEAAERSMTGFWGMMMVLGKYAARSPFEERMGLLWLLTNSLRDVQKFLGRPLSPTNEEMPAHPSPSEKIAILRDLASQMEKLMPDLEAAGVAAPYAVVPSMRRYLDLVEAVAIHS